MSTFTVRTTEKEEVQLNEFMTHKGIATKSKAISWLIENAGRLSKNDKILAEIVKAEKQLEDAKKDLEKVKSPHLNEYLY